MQLKRRNAAASFALALLSVLHATAAHAGAAPEATLELTGNYYYELSTRVWTPMAALDVGFDNPLGRTTVSADYALDAITSASLAVGAMRDQLITEYRNELSPAVAHDFGPIAAGLSYRFSKECKYRSDFLPVRSCDYVAHTVAAFAEAQLFDDTMLLRATLSYGHDVASSAFGGRTETLDTYFASLHWAQILDRHTIFRLGYDLLFQDGFQANIYRSVMVLGRPREEIHPTLRWRNTAVLEVRHRLADLATTIEIGYRFYWDTWQITGQDVSLRTYVDLLPRLELRAGYRFYAQNAASFWRPTYTGEPGDVEPDHYTGDPKLGPYQSHDFGLALEWDTALFAEIPVLGALRFVNFRYDYIVRNDVRPGQTGTMPGYGNAHTFSGALVFKLP